MFIVQVPKRLKDGESASMSPIVTIDQSLPVVVDKIYVKGNCRTKLSFLETEFREVLDQKITDGKNSSETNHRLAQIVGRLRDQGNFDAVHLNLVLNSALSDQSTTTDYLNAHIELELKEKSIPFLKLESYIKTKGSNGVAAVTGSSIGSDVGIEVQAALRNPLGMCILNQ